MKRQVLLVIAGFGMVGTAMYSCQKTSTPIATKGSSSDSSLTDAIASAQAVGVGSTSLSSAASDSMYVTRTCRPNEKRDSIAFSSLPQPALTYLDSAYAGYTAKKAFVITGSSGSKAGYVAIIDYGGKPVGVKFDSTGTFVRLLEQHLGRELPDFVRDHPMDEDSSSHHSMPPQQPQDSTGKDTSKHFPPPSLPNLPPHDSTGRDTSFHPIDSTHHH